MGNAALRCQKRVSVPILFIIPPPRLLASLPAYPAMNLSHKVNLIMCIILGAKLWVSRL